MLCVYYVFRFLFVPAVFASVNIHSRYSSVDGICADLFIARKLLTPMSICDRHHRHHRH